MENPIKMDDLGVPLFSETSIWIQTTIFRQTLWMPNMSAFSLEFRRHFRADGLQPTSKTSMSWRRLVPGDRVGDDLMTWQLLETFPQTLIEFQPFFLLIYWSFTQIPDLILYLYALNTCIYIYIIYALHTYIFESLFFLSHLWFRSHLQLIDGSGVFLFRASNSTLR